MYMGSMLSVKVLGDKPGCCTHVSKMVT